MIKESCYLIGAGHFAPKLWHQNFPGYAMFTECYSTNSTFRLPHFQTNPMTKFLQKSSKTIFWSFLPQEDFSQKILFCQKQPHMGP